MEERDLIAPVEERQPEPGQAAAEPADGSERPEAPAASEVAETEQAASNPEEPQAAEAASSPEPVPAADAAGEAPAEVASGPEERSASEAEGSLESTPAGDSVGAAGAEAASAPEEPAASEAEGSLEPVPAADAAGAEAAEATSALEERSASEAEGSFEPALAGDAAGEAPAEAASALMDAQAALELAPEPIDDFALKAVLEAIVYVTEEPVTPAQLAGALGQAEDRIRRLVEELARDFGQPGHGICLREVAGGYQMATKPEHHEAIRAFAKSLKPPLKLSLAALETLATIAYKQPITAPEIMAIRGVQGAGVLKTLLDRKLIAVAGRKNVIGRPMLYKTTKEFLVQFGLKDLSELPTLKEFEELRRLAVSEGEPETPAAEAPPPEPGGGPQENG